MVELQIGDKVGRLLLKKRIRKKYDQNRWAWECLCECGKECIVQERYLKNGKTKSCGCFHKDNLSKINSKLRKKYNNYDLENYEYGICYFINSDDYFIFDKEDYNKIKNFCWRKSKKGYAETTVPIEEKSKYKKKYLFAHNLILENIGIDHINKNRLDNRKLNLRMASSSENGKNKKVYKTNTSGISGVVWNKKNKKWIAKICYNYKQKFLGSFNNLEDAIIARLKAEKEYYGEFAPQRDLFEKYGI